jgi:hypothetical protein
MKFCFASGVVASTFDPMVNDVTSLNAGRIEKLASHMFCRKPVDQGERLELCFFMQIGFNPWSQIKLIKKIFLCASPLKPVAFP